MDSLVQTILTVFLSLLGSSTVSAVVLAVLKRHWDKKDEEAKSAITQELMKELIQKVDAAIVANKVIAKERVRFLGRGYINKNEISLEEKATLHEMYEAHKKLTATEKNSTTDGSLDPIMEEVDKLKISSKN